MPHNAALHSVVPSQRLSRFTRLVLAIIMCTGGAAALSACDEAPDSAPPASLVGVPQPSSSAPTQSEKKDEEQHKEREAEEQRKAEEEARLEQDRAEAERIAAEEEAARIAAEQAAAEEAARLAAEQAAAEEAARQQQVASLVDTAPAENVYYQNCTEARNAGAAPLHEGEPGYRPKLDRDGDGIACE